MASDKREMDTLQHAAELLRADPWQWQVTVEYPGFLLVQIVESPDDDNTRYYAAGFANPTLTVDRQSRDGGECLASVDTRVHCADLDGYRMAIHVAAAIDRMEHAGEDVVL
jgi:hypothetical protein